MLMEQMILSFRLFQEVIENLEIKKSVLMPVTLQPGLWGIGGLQLQLIMKPNP